MTTDALSYIKRAAAYADLSESDYPLNARIGLVTNFTDDIFQKLITGIALEAGIYPTVFAEPYKQYHFDLGNPDSALSQAGTDITFFVFDVSPYAASEFTTDPGHFSQILEQIRSYARDARGPVVIATFPVPLASAYGNLMAHDPLYQQVAGANRELEAIAEEYAQVLLMDLNQLIAETGEGYARDLRALYAFDLPFTNAFSLTVCRELMSYLFMLRGMNKKCIVVDLDNTLWGGIVGEVGADALALGPGYPGLAYQNFQRTLLSYAERGILLAIASRNNPTDVDEAFERNPHMILKKEHFVSMQINWNSKSENLVSIARDLNIGLDSLIFLDDDPANREEVRSRLPMVLVPELPSAPEEYARTLFSLPYFNQRTLTDEDRKKNELYAVERKRHEVAAAKSPSDYLSALGVEIAISENDPRTVARAAQLSQKTNQFNLTTKRYAEADIERLIAEGASIFTAEVRDRFGEYGIVALAIIRPGEAEKTALLDTFLMSCRAFARGVEFAVLDAVLETLRMREYRTVLASYQETAKNEPARAFLPSMGFSQDAGTTGYLLDLTHYSRAKPEGVSRTLPLLTTTRIP